MESPTCLNCASKSFEETFGGIDFCLDCGLAKAGTFGSPQSEFTSKNYTEYKSYTRLKRFKKYFFRAMRRQSSNTIPQETWEYLLARGDYRSAKHIQRTLKAARHLKRKCYDSLPFLTAALCPHIKVPELTEKERTRAFDLFDNIDRAIVKGPFISYLYCLEYILKKMGRDDVCEHINTIQCPKRRAAYKKRLDNIFQSQDRSVLSYFKYHRSGEILEVQDPEQFDSCSKSVFELLGSSVAPE